ncbi:MAG: hypothetical protein ACKPKO_40455, partial [Candidatus Fonsibacter sp.]
SRKIHLAENINHNNQCLICGMTFKTRSAAIHHVQASLDKGQCPRGITRTINEINNNIRDYCTICGCASQLNMTKQFAGI